MTAGEGFVAFHSREAPRLRLLVELVEDVPGRREEVLASAWLIVRHRWPIADRPDLWLAALVLRMLRRPGPSRTPSPPAEDPVLPVVAAVRALVSTHRQVVVLHHLLGLAATEVAEVVDLPESVVRDRLRDGVAVLREHLGCVT